MTDPRVEKLADVLTNYSVNIEKGDLVYISGNSLAEPLLKSVYRRVLEKGGFPEVKIKMGGFNEIFYKNASTEQLQYIPETRKYIMENADVLISIRGLSNTRELTNVSPKIIAKHREAMIPLMEIHRKRAAAGELQWTATQYPTEATAQESEMSISEYEDFVFKACFVDRDDPIKEWKKLSREQERYVKFLEEKKQFFIEAPGTELRVNAEGRKWINSDGKKNMPSGEVFTAPVKESINGKISFSFPAVYGGREVTGVKLEFKDGMVTGSSAEKGEEYLTSMLGMDEGAKYVGEFAFGLNSGIQQFTSNILFDEKIGGTMHMALGAAYPECGGDNKSALHWDMILDLRREGRVKADGDVIFEEGEFKL